MSTYHLCTDTGGVGRGPQRHRGLLRETDQWQLAVVEESLGTDVGPVDREPHRERDVRVLEDVTRRLVPARLVPQEPYGLEEVQPEEVGDTSVSEAGPDRTGRSPGGRWGQQKKGACIHPPREVLRTGCVDPGSHHKGVR